MFTFNKMKWLVIILLVLTLNQKLLAQNCQIIKVENAYNYIGKEIILFDL